MCWFFAMLQTKTDLEGTILEFATKNMSGTPCPFCLYTRSWKLRRGAKKCKRCRREFRVGVYPVAHIRSTVQEWKKLIEAFVTERTILSVTERTKFGQSRVEKMLTHLRLCMTEDVPPPFTGRCEADETFIGGQRKNKRIHIRRLETKRGHGTQKIPIVGVVCRKTGQARVKVLEERNEETVIGFMVSVLDKRRAVLFTDGYKMNRAVRKYGIRHFYVNHRAGEYVRGAIHSNTMEGFWGYLKRRLAVIGGIRHNQFPLFIGEIVWWYNHRELSRTEKEQALLRLVLSGRERP